MKKIQQRIMAGVLTLSIVLTMLPLTVFARQNVLYGDVNSSGLVDQNDVNDLKKYLAEYNIDIDREAADVNLDRQIDLKDLLLIEKHLTDHNIKLGDGVTITFDADGGTPVDSILLCKGAILSDVNLTEPVTQKDGYIFTGWVNKDGGDRFYAESPVTTDLNLKATYEAVDSQVDDTPASFALEDQNPDLSYVVVTAKDSTAGEVLENVSLTTSDGSDPVELTATAIDSKHFNISAADGFVPGCSYELALEDDGLTFQDKAASIRKATFIIHKDEVDNIQYNSDIKYIKDTDQMSYTISGTNETVPVLDISLISENQEGTVTGTFDYASGGVSVDDTLCIYKTVDPRDRDYIKNEYPDDPQSFIKITGIDGVTIHFSGLQNDDASDVIFIPQTVPFSVATLPSSDNASIDSTSYDQDGWSFMGQIDTPKFRVGDFIVLYSGTFADLTDDSTVYFGKITAVSGSTLTYTKTTKEAIVESNDMFLSNPLSGDDLLENADVPAMENQIEQQAMDSGFAADAVDYLINMAATTDNFQNMKLSNISYTDEQGNALEPAQMQALAKLPTKPDIRVLAHINKNTTKIDQGVHLDLTIDASFSIDLDDGNGAMKFQLHASFVEEIYVKVTMQAKAGVKWYFIIPVLKSLTFGADTDVKNFSSIAIDLRIYTVGTGSFPAWDQFKQLKDNYSQTLNQIQALQNMLADPFGENTDAGKINSQINDLWGKLPAGTKQSYEAYCDQFGEINMTAKLQEILHSTSDTAMADGVQALMDRYSKMLKQETDWVTLTERTIAKVDTKKYCPLVYVGIEISFVVKANVNISLGVSLDYLVGKRYSFWVDIIKHTSGNSTSDLTDEKYAFSFYVMGYIGLKMGVKVEITAGVLFGLAEAGISAEFGPYVKLWGYFIYMHTKYRPANSDITTSKTLSMGALYFEFGLYVTVEADVSIVGKSVYNPTLWDKEFPLLHAGVRNSVFAFATAIDKDESVLIADEDGNSNTGIMMKLPESYHSMTYIDLVLGDQEQAVYDLSHFVATLSNPNFAFNSRTGNITVTVPNDEVHYMNCNLVLTWKQGKVSFSSKDLRIVIPLYWTNLSASELKQKFTVKVNAGNPQTGYTTVWSGRVMKGEAYDLPTADEMKALMNYKAYDWSGTNLKYSAVAGYGSQQTTGLTTYTDQEYFFDATLREYPLTINDVQNAGGSKGAKTVKANFGDKFDISEVLGSGANDDANGKYTCYYTTVVKDSGGNVILSDIGRPLDIGFAKELLNGASYTAVYANNAVTATYVFTGDVMGDIADKTVSVKKGTTPPDLFTAAAAEQGAIVTGVTPCLGNISSDTVYTIVGKKKKIVMHTVTYETNGGSLIASAQVPEESLMSPPTPPARSGYTFVDWYRDPSLQDLFVFESMPAHDITLYAKWEGNSYQVTFDANGGTLPGGATNPVTVKNGTAYGTLPTPTRVGYRLDGWYTARTGGSVIRQGDAVSLTANITLYARWAEKTVINSTQVVCLSGQTATYNQKAQPVKYSVTNGMDVSSFTVSYKRQNLDSEWGAGVVNAGTYDIKITRPEDDTYKYFERTYPGVYIIKKAPSSIQTKPSIEEVYYGSVKAKKMTAGTDYTGGEQLEYAVNMSKTAVPTSGWSSTGVLYNIFDSAQNNFHSGYFYLWARVPESENYLASSSVVSDSSTAIFKPKALVSSTIGNKSLNYVLYVKTSDVTNAGTNAIISVKIGNGDYQHLDAAGNNDFERGNTDYFSLTIDPNLTYNTCGGIIPITLKYEKKGSAAGWHCAWVRLDVYSTTGGSMGGTQYNVNHWFGAEDHNQSTIEETYNLTGYERNVTFTGGYSPTEALSLTVTPTSPNYDLNWISPSITESKIAVSYNPYEYINAPELSVSFSDTKYNKYITQGIKSFSVASKDLYQAMIADGIARLTLTYTYEFKPLNGVSSVTANTLKRTRSIGVNASGAKSASSMTNASASPMLYGGSLAKVQSSVEAGQNGTFDVSYRLDQPVSLWGTKFAVNYDKNKVEMTGYTLGDVFSADEVTAPESYTGGRYVFLGTRGDFTNTAETGKLVTLHFKMKDGAQLTDDTVTLDTDATQAINADGQTVAASVKSNTAKISVSGHTQELRSEDTVTVTASAGNSTVQWVEVQKGDGGFADITETYTQGYVVTDSGTYTFRITTADGETATASITYTNLDSAQPEVTIDAGAYTEGKWAKGSVTLTPGNATSNKGTTAFLYRIGEHSEWTECPASGVTLNADGAEINTDYYFKAISESGLTSDIVKYTVMLDNKAPSGEIAMGQSKWNTFLNNITFGLFFKDTKAITVESTDIGSGMAKTEYYLSGAEVSDISRVDSWTEYTGPVTVEPNRKVIVYAKLTDAAGNVSIINSDGAVLFTDSTSGTASVSFTKSGTADMTAAVNLNGNTIKAVRIGGTTLTENTDYTVSGDTITLKAAYLNTLAAGNYTVSVSFYPLGETGTPKAGSDTPATIQFSLDVVKNVSAVSVNANPAGSQIRPSSVILSANLPAGATGTLQFKANGNNIGNPVSVGQTVSFTASGSVNDYTFAVSYSGDGNYAAAASDELSYSFVKGEQAALSFAAGTPAAKTYGDSSFAVTATGGSSTGAISYSVVSGPATISGNTVTLTGAGSVVLRATKAADDDYNAKSADTTITVGKKPVTITGVTAQNKTYDGSETAAISGTAVISGKVDGDVVSVSSGSAAFADKIVGNGKTVSFTGFTLSGADAGNYTLSDQPASVTANITAKPIIMNVTIQNKAYDGLNTAIIASAALNDVVSGDTINLVNPYPTATFESVSAANNIAVSFGGNFALTGTDAGNYILTQPSGITGNITNNYNAVKGTDYTISTTQWSKTDFIVTAKPGFELSLIDTAGGAWSETLTKSDETASGNLVFYVRNQATGAISAAAHESYKIDKTAPTGDIKIGASSIKKALNAITFGLFFKDTQSIEITSADTGSGVASVSYKLSSTVLEETAVEGISDWTTYTGAFTVEPDSQRIVYVKITDTAGNVLYLGSDGLVLDSTDPIISGIENGKSYCAAVTVTVTDANLDTVTVNGTAAALTDGKLTLSPTGTEQAVVAADKAGNSTTVKVTVYDGHTWDEGVITTPPTASKKGLKTYTCTHCGETKTEEIAMLAPSVTEGQDGTWKPDEGGTLAFKSDAAFSDFIRVLVDGKETPAKYYELKEGSIIVTLKADYLATLPAGTHTLGIESSTGTASTEFTVTAKTEDKTPSKPGNTDSPQTGDNSNNMPLWIALLFVSGGALTIFGIKNRKRKAIR